MCCHSVGSGTVSQTPSATQSFAAAHIALWSVFAIQMATWLKRTSTLAISKIPKAAAGYLARARLYGRQILQRPSGWQPRPSERAVDQREQRRAHLGRRLRQLRCHTAKNISRFDWKNTWTFISYCCSMVLKSY